LTIQDILRDPEITIGIFSHTRPHAKAFLRQIKRELEMNENLKALYPDILWQNPEKDAPTWSEDSGLVVQRKNNPKESTVEAWGLIDGQPTGRHYRLMVYDDVVVRDSVTTPDMIAKTTEQWELSLNLASENVRHRYIGTRWHFADTYGEMMRRQAVRPRIHPATEDGTPGGHPVLLTVGELSDRRRAMGPWSFASQMLLNPVADEISGFKVEWLQTHDSAEPGGLNVYILVDPANAKKKSSDYTAVWVIGLGQDENYYALDMYRDRLSLTQRADLVFRLAKKWRPLSVGYESYGMQADIQHIRDRMNRENYHFTIAELGGKLSKPDRIRRMVPVFEQKRVYLPVSCWKTNYEGRTEDLVDSFINHEYRSFPASLHDDMLDALARILDEDLHASWPAQVEEDKPKRYASKAKQASWMTM
jgi:phage terminase large subunit-like protein